MITVSLTIQTVLTSKNPTSSYLPPTPTNFLIPPKFPFPLTNSKAHFQNYRFSTTLPHLVPVTKICASFREPYGASQNQPHVYGSTLNVVNFDAFLDLLEFLCLASSAVVSFYIAVRCGLPKGGILEWFRSKILVSQCVVLVIGVLLGALIRRRQWRRICGVVISRGGSDSSGANLLERVEKLEDDLRSLDTIIKVSSRQLEKLWIRFRVTRKTLKEPIAETAALVQKNSEFTRELAAQEAALEKELGEIQKVLLAMQEQQQKQLELILAIAKARKLSETKHVTSQDHKASEASKSSVDDGIANSGMDQIEYLALQKEANNDKP